jgi:hypothetical protein
MKMIRLFIDVVMTDEQVAELQTIADTQPTVELDIEDYPHMLRGRFEGAQERPGVV